MRQMPGTARLPSNMTKVSFIVPKRDKPKLERAAKRAGKSMSAIISDALVQAGIFPKRDKVA